MSFLKNTWYVAAWADELSDQSLLARQIIGERVVLFRDPDNSPVALIDRCSHRFAPLSMGRLEGGCVECPYHGFRFNSSGDCVHNPHGDGRIPARAGIRAFPVVERHNAIWIWMGDAEKADADSIPAFEHMNPDAFYIGTGSMQVAGHYELETDNIMDLSHIEFVHPMFSSPAVSKGAVTHEIDGDCVWSKRDIDNDETPPDFIRQVFNAPEGPVDRWLHVHWQAPANMTLYAGGIASGQPREQAHVSVQSHWFTPETEQSTHYFYAATVPRMIGPAGEEIVKGQIEALYAPFKYEDAPLIEAQQRNIGEADFMEMKPIILNVDAAGHACRRIIARKLEEEAG